MIHRICSFCFAACLVLLFTLMRITVTTPSAKAATTHTPIIFVHGLDGANRLTTNSAPAGVNVNSIYTLLTISVSTA